MQGASCRQFPLPDVHSEASRREGRHLVMIDDEQRLLRVEDLELVGAITWRYLVLRRIGWG